PVGGTGPDRRLYAIGGVGDYFSGPYLKKTSVLAPLQGALVIVGHPPTALDSEVSNVENTPIVLTPDHFRFADPDAGDTLQAIQIVSLPAAGSLSMGGIISLADLAAGKLTFMPAQDMHGSPYTTFNFKVSDGNNFSDNFATMTVTVIDVNQAPRVSGSVRRSITEDDSDNAGFLVSDLLADLGISYSDPDTGYATGIAVTDANSGNGVWQ